MTAWLLFTYKVPNEPSARRVFVWRKLKGLGALLLHDSVWVLPDSRDAQEKLQWLATEVRDMEGGEAALWKAQQVFTGENMNLDQQFIDPVEASYQNILLELDKEDADLTALAKRYQKTNKIDYFKSKLREETRKKLVGRRGSE